MDNYLSFINFSTQSIRANKFYVFLLLSPIFFYIHVSEYHLEVILCGVILTVILVFGGCFYIKVLKWLRVVVSFGNYIEQFLSLTLQHVCGSRKDENGG